MSHKRYAIIVVICGMLISGMIVSTLFIWSNLVGEGSAALVIDRQKTHHHSLYLSGIKDNVIDYKLELYDQLNPQVVALGSSRAMQVQANFFNTNFVNLGGSVNSLPELDYVATKMIEQKRKPSIVLLFTDIWWFNEKYQSSSGIFTPPNQPSYLTLTTISLLMKPIMKSGVVISKEGRLGFGAIYQNQGFDFSGSFHYMALVTGETPSDDYQFKNTFNRIDTGTRRFEYSNRYSVFGLARFKEIVDRLEKSKMHVVIIFPPFANAVYQKMMLSGKYTYITSLIKNINNTDVFFNFTNPKDIEETNDCEFIDGFHGGATVYGKLLRQVAMKDKYLYDVTNFDYLSKLADHKGTSSPVTVALYGNRKPESDFLGLGCRKQI